LNKTEFHVGDGASTDNTGRTRTGDRHRPVGIDGVSDTSAMTQARPTLA
jgi:hypothetical protein